MAIALKGRRWDLAPSRIRGQALYLENAEAVHIEIDHEIGRPRCPHREHVARLIDRHARDLQEDQPSHGTCTHMVRVLGWFEG